MDVVMSHLSDYIVENFHDIFLRNQVNPKPYFSLLSVILKPFHRITRQVNELSIAIKPSFHKLETWGRVVLETKSTNNLNEQARCTTQALLTSSDMELVHVSRNHQRSPFNNTVLDMVGCNLRNCAEQINLNNLNRWSVKLHSSISTEGLSQMVSPFSNIPYKKVILSISTNIIVGVAALIALGLIAITTLSLHAYSIQLLIYEFC